MSQTTSRILFVLFVAAVTAIVVSAALWWLGRLDAPRPASVPPVSTAACVIKPSVLSGTSLKPAYASGEMVNFMMGEQCPLADLIQKDRLVLMRTGASKIPVAKFVKALPGERFAVQPVGNNFEVIVEDKSVVNSTKDVYILPKTRAEMIRLYVESYKGVIPDKAYLVMGDNLHGTMDSSQFGLINIVDVIGVQAPEE